MLGATAGQRPPPDGQSPLNTSFPWKIRGADGGIVPMKRPRPSSVRSPRP